MMVLLLYGVPILVGFVLGYFLALPVNIIISIVAVLFAGFAVWSTKDAELGSLVGVLVAVEVGIGLVSLWVTIGLVSGISVSVDLSWLLRVAA